MELNGSGGNVGYRNMKRWLLINYGFFVIVEMVRLVFVVFDVEGVFVCSRYVFCCRYYISKGFNFLIYIDGWDKFKFYGILIYVGIDGYFCCILWLRVCSLNKKLEYIVYFYLKYVREINGVLFIIYGDRGIENVIVRDI